MILKMAFSMTIKTFPVTAIDSRSRIWSRALLSSLPPLPYLYHDNHNFVFETTNTLSSLTLFSTPKTYHSLVKLYSHHLDPKLYFQLSLFVPTTCMTCKDDSSRRDCSSFSVFSPTLTTCIINLLNFERWLCMLIPSSILNEYKSNFKRKWLVNDLEA